MPEQITHRRNHRHRLEQLFDAALDLEPMAQAALLEHECAGDVELRRELEALLHAARQPTDRDLKRQLAAVGQDAQTVQLKQPFRQLPPAHDRETLVFPPEWPEDEHILSELATEPTQPIPPHVPVPPEASAASFAEAHASGAGTPAPGTRIQQYELIRELGQGGMGTVYLARDTKLGRRVAIKFLQRVESKHRERFILEARTTARCNHENIVVIHEVNELHGHPFMVLEYLKGKPLTKLIANKVLPPERAVELMIPVLRALVCAHAENIVHRDLKPDNILVTDTGHIKVLDFGIAKYLRPQKQIELIKTQVSTLQSNLGPLPHTQDGMLVGTLRYMSPEQWGVGEVDHRTDLWAVGIILFQMLTGRHPLHERNGLELSIVGDLDAPMPNVRAQRPEVPPRLAEIIGQCLAKHKEKRIASARKLLAELETLRPQGNQVELSSGENPYAGLRAFQERDARRFFGRNHEIGCMLALLRDQPLVSVVGPSGVGKSSLVRAGVIPALKNSGETWDSIVIRPGRHPMEVLAGMVAPMLQTAAVNLADAMSKQEAIAKHLYHEPGFLGVLLRSRAHAQRSRILIFIDQFEELYTLVPDAAERAAFMACLRAAADDATAPLRVMLSIRADFLYRMAEDQSAMAELMPGLFFLAPPERHNLHEVLTQPAEMAGYRFESADMVEAMLDRLQDTPGALPLLQFAATKLWEQRDREQRVLTRASYERIGGVDGALASHADMVLNSLSPQRKDLARSIFLRLITAEGTRAIATLDELWALSPQPGEVQLLVDSLVDARLLVMQGTEDGQGATVEIIHESLIRSWPQLGRWLDEHKDDLIFLERLRASAGQWEAGARSAGLLWRGEVAAEADRWARRYRGELPAVQRAYLEAVLQLARRSRRNARLAIIGTIGGLSILAVVSIVVALVIREAQKEAALQAQNYANALAKIRQLTESLGNMDREYASRVREILDGMPAQGSNEATESAVLIAQVAMGEGRVGELEHQLSAREKQIQTLEKQLRELEKQGNASMEQLNKEIGALRDSKAKLEEEKNTLNNALKDARAKRCKVKWRDDTDPLPF